MKREGLVWIMFAGCTLQEGEKGVLSGVDTEIGCWEITSEGAKELIAFKALKLCKQERSIVHSCKFSLYL